MTTSLKEHFSEAKQLANLRGFGFESEAACKTYFTTRVKAKIQEADATELLRECLVEMADTGFNTVALQLQIQNPPRAKDWEIGEAFAEAMLEDRFEASFPWQTSWDKRTPKASLPGPDIPGFHGRSDPRFLFGEIKSSSERQWPPQVVNRGDDCLSAQMSRLLQSQPHRQKLIEWLLVRVKDSPKWMPVFQSALNQYAQGKASTCGILVRGGLDPNKLDLSALHEFLATSSGTFDVLLYAFYLPFDKARWPELIYGMESTN